MIIKNLRLNNFRNYKKVDLVFDDRVNVLIGNNANGKTNVIEAIYSSAIGKSFRTSKDAEMIKFGEEDADIYVNAEQEDGEKTEVNIKIGKQGKMIKVNDVAQRRMSDIFENIYCVIFSPEDLKLIKGDPAARRRFVDIELSMIKKSYYRELVLYKKILMQRNALLKSRESAAKIMKHLDIWEEKLSEHCANIMIERAALISGIEEKARDIQKNITSGIENLSVKYNPSIKSNALEKAVEEGFIKIYERSITNSDYSRKRTEIREILKSEIIENFSKNRKRDITVQTTTTGIHRDDISIFIDNNDVKKYGSQGQQRTVVLSLKLAQLKITEEMSGVRPVLLLDDVLSELDKERQTYLLSNIDGVQVFITCADLNDEQEKLIKTHYKLFRVKKNESGEEEIF